MVVESEVKGIFRQWSPGNSLVSLQKQAALYLVHLVHLVHLFTCSVSGSPVGVEEGDGGGGGVEGDEGGCQGASQAPGQKALPWDHLQNQTELSVGGGKQALLCNHCMRMPHSKYLSSKDIKIKSVSFLSLLQNGFKEREPLLWLSQDLTTS